MSNIPDAGERVTGAYFGVPFTGTLESRRPHTMNRTWLFFVKFDQPVTLYGLPRDGACVTTDDGTTLREQATGSWINRLTETPADAR